MSRELTLPEFHCLCNVFERGEELEHSGREGIRREYPFSEFKQGT